MSGQIQYVRTDSDAIRVDRFSERQRSDSIRAVRFSVCLLVSVRSCVSESTDTGSGSAELAAAYRFNTCGQIQYMRSDSIVVLCLC